MTKRISTAQKRCRRFGSHRAPMAVFALLFLSAVGMALAQHVSLDVQPRTIRLNETATLKLNFINLNPPQSPALPEIPGFEIAYVGQEQQFQFVNGNQERRLTYNYRLQPRSTGQFTLGPFALNMNGSNIELDSISMEVLPPSGAGGSATGETIDDLVFARIHLPRTEVYLQERFDVELALYYRGVQLDRGIQLQNLPSTGLNLEDFQEIGSTREARGNEIYEVRRFRMRGTALTAGTFQLAPMVRVNVLVKRERQHDPFMGGFDDFFFGRHEAQPLSVPAEPMDVMIRPLPTEGRPDTFGGAVGKFDMHMEVQPNEVAAGDPITLTVRISGQGNFESLSMPSINLGDDFRRYDPKLIASGNDHKVFEQVFIPRSDRIRELPAVSFSFFDPEQMSYQTIVRGPLPLLVKAGSSEAPQVVQAPSSSPSPDREPLGIDIIDIKRTAAHWTQQYPGHATRINPTLLTLPLLAIGVLGLIVRRRDSIQRDIGRQRRAQAPRSAQAALRRAEQALSQNQPGAFHEAIWQALADYFAHRGNLQAGEVSPEWIVAKMRDGGLSAPRVAELEGIIRSCEEARFARIDSHGNGEPLRDLLRRAQEILRACEKIRL
jgi:hypothetical protein